jgi:hypothetical protein
MTSSGHVLPTSGNGGRPANPGTTPHYVEVLAQVEQAERQAREEAALR